MSDPLRIAAYLVLAASSLIMSGRRDRTERGILTGVALLGAVLAIAIAISAAGLLADFGRSAARTEGWYQDRRTVQAAVILALGFGAFVAMAAIWLGLGRLSLFSRLLLSGVISLLAYLAARTISLHQLDAVLVDEYRWGVRRGDLLEIALVLTLAALPLRFVSRRPPDRVDARSM